MLQYCTYLSYKINLKEEHRKKVNYFEIFSHPMFVFLIFSSYVYILSQKYMFFLSEKVQFFIPYMQVMTEK